VSFISNIEIWPLGTTAKAVFLENCPSSSMDATRMKTVHFMRG